MLLRVAYRLRGYSSPVFMAVLASRGWLSVWRAFSFLLLLLRAGPQAAGRGQLVVRLHAEIMYRSMYDDLTHIGTEAGACCLVATVCVR